MYAEQIALSGDKPKTSVFISYAREDSAIAYKLEASLLALGFAVLIDKTDIALGEDWQNRIEGMIVAADVVVFVLSPHAVCSKVCNWEAERTEELKKRLLPVKWLSVEGLSLPPCLSRPNWGDFTEVQRLGLDASKAFLGPLTKLVEAIETDISWVREHTKWVARAVEWGNAAAANREGKLLPTGDIADVQAWLQRKPWNAPEVPTVLADYVAESIGKEDRHSRQYRRTRAQAFVIPAQQALEEGRHEQALRLAAAGAVLGQDLEFRLVPELWGPAARALSEGLVRVVLRGHAGPLTSAAFSPDAKRVVTASVDRTARVWDARTGKEFIVLNAHVDEVTSAAFSPDGKRVVTASRDKTARIWDAETGKQIVVLSGHDEAVRSGAFNPDGKRVVTASNDHTVRVWDTETGGSICVLEGHKEPVIGAVFALDGDVVSASDDGTVRYWNAEKAIQTKFLKCRPIALSGTFLATNLERFWSSTRAVKLLDVRGADSLSVLKGFSSRVNSAAVSPDKQWFVTSSEDGTATLWDATSSKPATVLRGHEGPAGRSGEGRAEGVVNASFSPDNRRLVTASRDGTARIWETCTRAWISVLSDWDMTCAVFSADGTRVITASKYGEAQIWETDTGKLIAALKSRTGVSSAIFSPQGTRVLTVAPDSGGRLWNARTGKEILLLQDRSRGGPHTSVIAFTPDGSQFMTVSTEQRNEVCVWGSETGERIAATKTPLAYVDSAALCRDGRRAVIAAGQQATVWNIPSSTQTTIGKVRKAGFSPDGKHVLGLSELDAALLWDVETGTKISSFRCPGAELYKVVATSDGRRIVGAADNGVHLWDALTGAGVAFLAGDRLRVVVGPAGKRIVTFTPGARVAYVWDSETGARIASLNAHRNGVNGAYFSPDGRCLLTTSNDHTARLWDMETNTEITVLKGHQGPVVIATFSPDGTRVVTGCEHENARVWDVSRAVTINRERAASLSGGLAAGIGWIPASERDHFLLRDIPTDLFTAVQQQLPTGARSDVVTLAEVKAPLHPNCYLPPDHAADSSANSEEGEGLQGCSATGLLACSVIAFLVFFGELNPYDWRLWIFVSALGFGLLGALLGTVYERWSGLKNRRPKNSWVTVGGEYYFGATILAGMISLAMLAGGIDLASVDAWPLWTTMLVILLLLVLSLINRRWLGPLALTNWSINTHRRVFGLIWAVSLLVGAGIGYRQAELGGAVAGLILGQLFVLSSPIMVFIGSLLVLVYKLWPWGIQG